MTFRTALAAEWTKLAGLRSTTYTLVAMAVLLVGLGLFAALTDSYEPTDTVLGISLVGGALAQIVAANLGVLAVTGEFATGTIAGTVAAYPRRGRLLGAKAVVVGGLVFFVGLVAGGLSYVATTLTLGEVPNRSGPVVAGLLGVAGCLATVGVLAVAVGALLRHTAGAVTAMLGVLLVPFVVAPMLPAGWAPWLLGGTPTSALIKLPAGDTVDAGLLGILSPGGTLTLVGGYTLAALLTAVALFRRRDVPLR